jgi:Zn-dependent protease
MPPKGYVTLGRMGPAPIRVSWTFPVGAVVFSGFHFDAGLIAGFLAIVLVHEIGHALLVRRAGLPLVAIDVHGFGGACRYGGAPTPAERGAIAWGGVLAQVALFGATLLVLRLAGPPAGPFGASLVEALLAQNLLLAALNLLPLAPFDGAEAWPFVLRALLARLGRGRPASAPPASERLTRPPSIRRRIERRALDGTISPMPPELRAQVKDIIDEAVRRSMAGGADALDDEDEPPRGHG